MDTECVRLFVVAADMLNISAAGRQLGLAPAVASARLSKLERQVGADLFRRTTRKVVLSREGEDFLPFAREILAQEDAARAALEYRSPGISGTLRFAASSTFAQLYIAPILPEFLERYPGVNLDLRFSDTQIDLIEGGFDLALRNYPIQDSSLKARKLANDKRILCASPEYLERHGVPESPEDLQQHQLIVFQGGTPRKLSPSGKGGEHTFPPQSAVQRIVCDDGASMRIATAAGAGIALNSIWSVYRELVEGTIIRVLPDYFVDDGAAVWLIYPQSQFVTAKVRVFIDFLLEKTAQLPVWDSPV